MPIRNSPGMEGLFVHPCRTLGQTSAPSHPDLLALRREADRLRSTGDPWSPLSSSQPSTPRWVHLWLDFAAVLHAPGDPAHGSTGRRVLAFYDGERFVAPPAEQGMATHWKDLEPGGRLHPHLVARSAAHSPSLPVMVIPRAAELALVA